MTEFSKGAATMLLLLLGLGGLAWFSYWSMSVGWRLDSLKFQTARIDGNASHIDSLRRALHKQEERYDAVTDAHEQRIEQVEKSLNAAVDMLDNHTALLSELGDIQQNLRQDYGKMARAMTERMERLELTVGIAVKEQNDE